MCIAILKKQGTTISDEYLENCFENNSDGAGIAYAKDGKLYYHKGIFDKDKFIKVVREAEKVAQGAMLIHCRIGTSGLRDSNNCHPHIVNDRTVLIHNGVLSVDVPKDSKVSDTVVFIEQYLKNLPKDFMNNEAICKLIEKAIGGYNKFVLLNNKGEFKIINEKAGEWKNNIWYSNTSYSYSKAAIFYKPMNDWDDEDYKGAWKQYTQKTLPFAPTKTLPSTHFKPTSSKRAFPMFDAENVKKQIQKLSNFEIMEIGEYPVYDRYKQKIVPESDLTMADDERYRYLDDLDEDCYEEYLYEVQLRGLINELQDEKEEEKPQEDRKWYRAI